MKNEPSNNRRRPERVSAVSLWRHKQLCDPRGDNERFGCSGYAAPPHVHSHECVRPGGEGGHDAEFGIDLVGPEVCSSRRSKLDHTPSATPEKKD